MKGFKQKLERAKRESTLQLLFKCSRLLNERAIATMPQSGDHLGAAHLALFPHIELERGTRITELSEKLAVTKQAVGQLVDDLERMGIVIRQPDPDDGRAKRVAFTSQGKRSMLSGLKHLQNVEEQLAQGVGQDVVRELRSLLLIVHDHLDP